MISAEVKRPQSDGDGLISEIKLSLCRDVWPVGSSRKASRPDDV